MKSRIARLFKRTLDDMFVIVRDFFQCTIAGSYFCPRWLRRIIYTIFGNKIQSSRINPKNFIGGTKLHVGKRTFISYDNFFDLTDDIYIGDNVHIAMRSTFITSTHEISKSERRAGNSISAPITIGNGCWIGGGSRFCPELILAVGQ